MVLPTRRVAAIVSSSVFLIGALIFLISSLSGFGQESLASFEVMSNKIRPTTLSTTHRKLLLSGNAIVEPDRYHGDKCIRSDIVVTQGPTSQMPSGIPSYRVQIINTCLAGCNISKIHLNCGWFSSAHVINPKVFKRLRYDDCLVNDGKPLTGGEVIHFQYSNTHPYPLSVSSFHC